MSLPSKLEPLLVQLVLDYIAPPTDVPIIPIHLISPPLRQRHHFLHISPEQHSQYLQWPSSDEQHVAHLLSIFQKPQNEREYSEYSVRYTSDPHSSFAHVNLRITPDDGSPALRLVFYWDHSDNSWKYHNLSLMPFPPASFDSPSPHDFLLDRSPSVDDQNGDDDDYWNSYGASAESDPVFGHDVKDNSVVTAEDTYWNQYANVQGSGDSTLPSPLPPKRKLIQPHDYPLQSTIFSYSTDPIEVYNPLEPPSADSLSRRLSELSPRPDSPSLLDDSASGSCSASTPPSSTTHALESQTGHSKMPADDTQFALEQSIRGIYQLWKATKRGESSEMEIQESFMAVVRGVVQGT